MTREIAIEGFEYNSYPQELVRQILVRYLAGASYEAVSLQVEGASFAGVQRVINHAIKLGVIEEEDKHRSGGGFAIKRARKALEKHGDLSIGQIASLASCHESTVYRARRANGLEQRGD